MHYYLYQHPIVNLLIILLMGVVLFALLSAVIAALTWAFVCIRDKCRRDDYWEDI